MLTESATIKLRIDDKECDICVTPLFLHSQTEPWVPNEIFELLEVGNNKDGVFTVFEEPVEQGKIIVNDRKEWHYEGNGNMDENVVQQIAEFVLTYEGWQ